MVSGIAQDPLLYSSGVLVCSIRTDWRANQGTGEKGCINVSEEAYEWLLLFSVYKQELEIVSFPC